MDKIHMTWNEFESDITEFVEYMKKIKFDKDSVILGLKRGGLPSAVYLSNKLDIPISLVSFQTRDNNDVEPKFLEPEIIKNTKNVIIVDDIYDSGLTVDTLIDELGTQFNKPFKNIAGLFHYGTPKLQDSKLKYYRRISSNKNKWVVFPWES